ncbi:MAG: GNAT family N-acetyltransferase [Pseudomonadota bacterium]
MADEPGTPDDVLIRPPRLMELRDLGELCLRSKAVHGYSAAMLSAMHTELLISGEELARDSLAVAECAGTAIGVVQVTVDEEGCHLEKLFIEPQWIGHGVGARLLDWAMAEARARGAEEMLIDADPGAAAFYESRGAKRVGEVPSGSIPGRCLPRLVLPL